VARKVSVRRAVRALAALERTTAGAFTTAVGVVGRAGASSNGNGKPRHAAVGCGLPDAHLTGLNAAGPVVGVDELARALHFERG
jgi:hypothetical protein